MSCIGLEEVSHLRVGKTQHKYNGRDGKKEINNVCLIRVFRYFLKIKNFIDIKDK